MFKGTITAKPSFECGRIYIRIKGDEIGEFTYSIPSAKSHLSHSLSTGDRVKFSFKNKIVTGRNQETNYPTIKQIELINNTL